ncbi:MAG: hypothetical protein ACFFCQ_13610 [Promethearchaeota archaeon]
MQTLSSRPTQIKLRYGRHTTIIASKGRQVINLIIAGAVKVGKTTFLKSIQTMLLPGPGQILYSAGKFVNIFPGGEIGISGIGEDTLFGHGRDKLTTTTRFNYLGKIILFWRWNRDHPFQQVTVNLYDSPGYFETSIINLLWRHDIEKERLGAYGMKFRITDYLPPLINKRPTLLTVLVSPGGPVLSRKAGSEIMTVVDEDANHGIETLKEIVREIQSKDIRALPLMIGFTKTDCPLPASHYGKSGEMRQWGNVKGIVDLASLPYVPMSMAWEKTERFFQTLFRILCS